MTRDRGRLSSLALAFLLVGVAPSACDRATPAGADASTVRVPDGVWGATGVRLDVNGATVAVEFDCAHGTLPGPLMLDAQHRFSVTGAFVREQPGPRRDVGPPAQEAQYMGLLERGTLTVTVRVGTEEIGPFTLAVAEPLLMKCL